MFDGWLRAKRELDSGSRSDVFELEVVAVNLDLQKSASVKCNVFVSCDNEKYVTISLILLKRKYQYYKN